MLQQNQVLPEQQNNSCNLLEQGIYSEGMFLKRNNFLREEIDDLKVRIEELEETCHNNIII